MGYSQGTDTVIYRELDESFVDAVSDLLSDATKRRQLGVAGRNLVISKGSWQDFVNKFFELAQNVATTR